MFFIELSGTPEAGKTTCIGLVRDNLEKIGLKVNIVREAAELVPENFIKGSYEANLWMCCKAIQLILEAQRNNDTDIIIADRAIFDQVFWNEIFKNDVTREYYEAAAQFYSCIPIKIDLLVALMVSPETSIKRRGGEGRIVTKKFVAEYNETFLHVFDSWSKCQKKIIHTDDMDKKSVADRITAWIMDLYM